MKNIIEKENVKYLIYKKGTNKIECICNGSQGTNNEQMLLPMKNNIQKAVIYDTYEDAQNKIEYYKQFFKENNGRCSLYFYDSDTKPEDLGILEYNQSIKKK